jgi:hypothetical protein
LYLSPWRKLRRTLLLGALVSSICLVGVFLIAAACAKIKFWWADQALDRELRKRAVGALAPNFVLKDLAGQEFHLRDHASRQLVVLEFGSATCPYSCGTQGDAMEAMAKKYRGKAEFVFVYCRETHPLEEGGIGSRYFNRDSADIPLLPQTHSRAERVKQAEFFRRKTKTQRRILVDEDGQHSVLPSFGLNARAPATLVVERGGRIGFRGTSPALLEQFLREHLGIGDKPGK